MCDLVDYVIVNLQYGSPLGVSDPNYVQTPV